MGEAGGSELPTISEIRNAEAKYLPLDQAHDEANLIQAVKKGVLETQRETIIAQMEKEKPGKKVVIGDFYELTNRFVAEEQKQSPDLHAANLAFFKSRSRLAATLAPDFIKIGGKKYISPGRRAVLAKDALEKAKTENPGSENNPWTKARHLAEEIILRVADKIDPLKDEDNIDVVVEIAKAIKDEVKDNNTIYQGDLNPEQIGALTEGVLAVKNIDYWQKQLPVVKIKAG